MNLRESTMRAGLTAVVAAIVFGVEAQGEDYGNRLGVRAGGQQLLRATGPAIGMTAMDPTVRRWYLPQELFSEYGRQQGGYTNYARERYLRYQSAFQEGQYYYDVYGDFITRGWLIYDWRQTQPLSFESSEVTKSDRYASWFQRLVVSSDAGGDYSYSITIGDEINTTLTPMTFRKAGFNGIVLSAATSRVRTTGLLSRVSAPKIVISPELPTERLSNATNLAAARLEADVRDEITLGLTFVNAHNANGSRDGFEGNPFTGQLTSGQLGRRQNLVVVRLADDSPEDGEGGAVLFGADVAISTKIERRVAVTADSVVSVLRDTVLMGSGLGFQPALEGGRRRGGFLTADGAEEITLSYRLAPEGVEASDEGSLRLRLQQRLGLSLAEAEDVITNIDNIRFHLVLANDYRVDVASDRQTSAAGQPQFLTMARAPGNIKNRTNQREVVFDFGLPTANHVYGLSVEIRDLHGLDFYGEFNINNQFRKYPAVARDKHETISGVVGDERAVGWMANLSKRWNSWRLFAEAFGMDHDYNTDILVVDGRGVTDYSPEASNLLYDFVDDNDDDDRHPDQLRLYQGSLIFVPGDENRAVRPQGRADPEVFPGYDENGDFISDFNQNSNGDRRNFYPDYEEPFLRYHSDRPEFLFGIDLNNNGWVDRFENDDLPDYPYKRDHWGYNIYTAVRLSPEIELTVGRLVQEMRAADRDNRTVYGIFALDRSVPGWGRLRLFDMLKKAADTIPDPLTQWTIQEAPFGQPATTSGFHQTVEDDLAAADTWINTLYADWEIAGGAWSTRHRFKWERVAQRQNEVSQAADGSPVTHRVSGFTGLISKVECALPWKTVTLSPRFKSELRRQTPFSRSLAERRSWDGILFFLVDVDVLHRSSLQIGLEQRWFFDLLADGALAPGSPSGDFRGTVLALQLTNRSAYVGYELTTQVGLRYDRRSLELVAGGREGRTSGLAFLTVFAAI